MKEDNKYQSINQRINQSMRYYRVPSKVEKGAALDSLLNKINTSGTSSPKVTRTLSLPLWIRTTAAMAAAVVLAVIFWIVFASQNIKNQENEVVTLRLPDHSRVILTNESSISYSNFFWSRKLKLKGKAYFEVEKGNKFKVLTSKGNVEVLGTRFMVDENKDKLQVICFEGKVKASFNHSDVLLLAGCGINFSENENQVQLKEEELYPGFALFSGNYINTEMGTVLKDMEMFFGVQINNQTGQKRFFTGSMNTGNLDVALSILTGSLKLEYDHSGKNKVNIHK
jgi:transmembrane sensor